MSEEMEDPTKDRGAGIAMMVLAGIVFVAGFLRASRDTVDDAYISFRSVKNLLSGGGLSFNPGTRVESFSNPLMVFMTIPTMAAGIPPEISSLLIGIVSFAFCVVGTWFLTKLITGRELLAWGASASVLACFPLLYYSITGLETGLFAALILATAWRFTAKDGLDICGAILLACVAYSRPEGIAYVIAIVPVIWFATRRPRPIQLAIWMVVVLSVMAGFVARKLYFGEWLPNTFTAKPPGTGDLDPATGRLSASLLYVAAFVAQMGVIVFLLAFNQRIDINRPSASICAMAFAATGLAFGLYTGGDWFPAGRYLLPVAPLIVTLGFAGAGNLSIKTAGKLPLRLAVGGAFLALVCGSIATLSIFWAKRDKLPYHVMNTADIREAALWIRDNSPADAKIAAFRIGALGYYGERFIIDLHGLADKEIARAVARHPEYQPSHQMGMNVPEIRDYVRQLRPYAALAVNSVGLENPPALPFYGYNYTLQKVFPQGADQTWLYYVYTPVTENFEGAPATGPSPDPAQPPSP